MKHAQKKQLHSLYIELVKLQKEIIASDRKLLIILEGRDAAGKDGTIKRIVKHLSPRETHVVALGKPTERENNQWYFQRYTEHLPANGEIAIFNRSWYNRAGVEHVMGFCSDKQYKDFFRDVALFEEMLLNAGIVIVKYYLDISKQEQAKRLDERKEDPLKQWKISPIDSEAQKNWEKYSMARNEMLKRTHFKTSPWYIANAENKDDIHIALISHLLRNSRYKGKNKDVLKKENDLIVPASPHHIKNKLYV